MIKQFYLSIFKEKIKSNKLKKLDKLYFEQVYDMATKQFF